MISIKEVSHIAKLAKLELNEDEIEKHQKEFLKILDYVEKLKEVDVCWYQIPTSLLVSDTNNTRKDRVLKFNKKLIDGHLKVKSIL